MAKAIERQPEHHAKNIRVCVQRGKAKDVRHVPWEEVEREIQAAGVPAARQRVGSRTRAASDPAKPGLNRSRPSSATTASWLVALSGNTGYFLHLSGLNGMAAYPLLAAVDLGRHSFVAGFGDGRSALSTRFVAVVPAPMKGSSQTRD